MWLCTYTPVNNDDLDGQHIGVVVYACRNSAPASRINRCVRGIKFNEPEISAFDSITHCVCIQQTELELYPSNIWLLPPTFMSAHTQFHVLIIGQNQYDIRFSFANRLEYIAWAARVATAIRKCCGWCTRRRCPIATVNANGARFFHAITFINMVAMVLMRMMMMVLVVMVLMLVHWR